MTNNKYRAMAYVPTPKCASSSIRAALAKFFNLQGTDLQSVQLEWNHTNQYLSQIPDAPPYSDQGIIFLNYFKTPEWESKIAKPQQQQDLGDDVYAWTVVRNPWHRVASVYEMLTTNSGIVSGCWGDKLDLSFSDFVRVVTSGPIYNICSHEKPERYFLSGPQEDQTAVSMLATITAVRSPNSADGEELVTGYGAGLSLVKYRNIEKTCNAVVLAHTQRWEDSVLFSGQVTVKPIPMLPEHDPEYKESLKGLVALPHQVLEKQFSPSDPDSHKWHFPASANNSPQPMITLNKVVRFENLISGIEEVCDEFGIPPLDLPHLNKTEKLISKMRYYEEMYEGNDELIQAVQSWYEYEINTFGYEFGTNL